MPDLAATRARSGSSCHVLHVTPGLLGGGMELTMAKVIRGLDGAGMRHSILALKGEAEIAARLPGRTGVHLLHARPNEPQLPLRIARLIRAVRPDVIHARNWGAWPDTVAALLLLSCPVPLIFSFHGLGRAGYMPTRRRWASAILARLTTRLFTVSRQSRDMLAAHWYWPSRRTDVVPNGVDTALFCPRRRTGGALRIIGTVGNLRSVKNHLLLLESFAELVREGLDLVLRIAGEGDMRPALEAKAQEMGVGARVSLPGRIDDVPRFLQGLDLFVLSSDSEQHPNALNEAMACGLPCISTRVGCASELLDGGRCGLLVQPGERGAMVQAMERLVQAPSLSWRLGRLARNHVCENYSLDVMLERYERLYLDTVRYWRGRRRR